jgi:hypothetical protein
MSNHEVQVGKCCSGCPFHRSEYEDRGRGFTHFWCDAGEYLDVESANLPDDEFNHEPSDCPLTDGMTIQIRRAAGQPGFGGAAPFQQRFHQSTDRKRASIAANKIGKTYGGAAESWCYLLDEHPYRETMGPGTLGWVLCQDHTTGWPEISANLRIFQRPDVLDPSCHYVEGAGYLTRGAKALTTRFGSRLECKSCKQELQALEGPRVHWGWVNEPPTEAHFNAMRARMSMDIGPLWLTLTPVNRPVDWLRDKIEGNPETGDPSQEPDWWVEHTALSYDEAPHRTRASIDAQIAECDAWEYNQRILAQWEGVAAGRKLAAFSEACIFGDAEMPTQVDEIRMGFDWGEGDGKTRCYLEAIQGRRVWLLGEYSSNAENGWQPRDHARGILGLLKPFGLTIHHVDAAYGDTNSAGLIGAGIKYNRLIESALATELGLSRCPITIQPAQKRKGAPRASISAMNAMMQEGNWLVHESCRAFIRSCRYFTGREADLKDALDGARYGVMDILLQPGSMGPAPMLVL